MAKIGEYANAPSGNESSLAFFGCVKLASNISSSSYLVEIITGFLNLIFTYSIPLPMSFIISLSVS